MNNSRRQILNTIIYADIFEFPLKVSELKKFLISPVPVSDAEFEENLKNLFSGGLIESHEEFLFLPGRRGFVQERLNRESVSKEKLKKLRKFIKLISFLPFIKMVGLTGDSSYANAKPSSDLDLMIVTSVGRMWLSRMLTFFLLEILGLKMKEKKNNEGTKICINVWCDEDNLQIPENERDLVLASDIVHLIPMVNRENTYERFISGNLWLKNYFSNWSY